MRHVSVGDVETRIAESAVQPLCGFFELSPVGIANADRHRAMVHPVRLFGEIVRDFFRAVILCEASEETVRPQNIGDLERSHAVHVGRHDGHAAVGRRVRAFEFERSEQFRILAAVQRARARHDQDIVVIELQFQRSAGRGRGMGKPVLFRLRRKRNQPRKGTRN